jgi:hypothetical protein
MPDELMKEFEASRKALVVAQVPQGAAGATGAEAAALGAEQSRDGDQPVLGTGAQQEPEVHEEAQQAEHGEEAQPEAGGQTETVPQPGGVPQPQEPPATQFQASGKSGPTNWNWKVEIKEEKTWRVTKILYRSIIRFVRQWRSRSF